ncbi:MAG: Ig-like domain-containing protein [Microbispora sp.]|nr:Ig-like domain-containing protein [Microbispora sp.]
MLPLSLVGASAIAWAPDSGTVHVGTFQYGEWDATERSLAGRRARQAEDTDPPFTDPTDEQARRAALDSDVRVPVNANEQEVPPGLSDEELERFAADEGGGFEDHPESEPGRDTVAPQAMTNPADGDIGVPIDAGIRVAFTESVTHQIFTLKDSSGIGVRFTATPIGDDPATEEIEPAGQGWVLTPAKPLKEAERYRIEVKAAKDAAGNVMADYSATFTTAKGTTPA